MCIVLNWAVHTCKARMVVCVFNKGFASTMSQPGWLLCTAAVAHVIYDLNTI
jgi:hypothetical protein